MCKGGARKVKDAKTTEEKPVKQSKIIEVERCPDCKEKINNPSKRVFKDGVWVNETFVKTEDESGREEKVRIRYCSGCGHVYGMRMITQKMVGDEEAYNNMNE
jgi:uncharacterized protein with PIN domain